VIKGKNLMVNQTSIDINQLKTQLNYSFVLKFGKWLLDGILFNSLWIILHGNIIIRYKKFLLEKRKFEERSFNNQAKLLIIIIIFLNATYMSQYINKIDLTYFIFQVFFFLLIVNLVWIEPEFSPELGKSLNAAFKAVTNSLKAKIKKVPTLHFNEPKNEVIYRNLPGEQLKDKNVLKLIFGNENAEKFLCHSCNNNKSIQENYYGNHYIDHRFIHYCQSDNCVSKFHQKKIEIKHE
jgi:hypothetical protein